MSSSYHENKTDELRVLFCFGVTQSFFDEPPSKLPEIIKAITEAFADLSGRFGLRVLGTIDDDELMVGNSFDWPWTCYILADAPGLGAVKEVTNIIREGEVNGHRLWRYMRVEARVGRQLFFGNE